MARTTFIVNIMPRRSSHQPHRIVAIAYENLSTFEFAIVLEVFGIPPTDLPSWYRFDVCTVSEGPLKARGGVKFVPPKNGMEMLKTAHTILIPGWSSPDAQPSQELIAALCKAHKRGARLVSICSGSFVIAATGLLNGKRATTHWRYAELLSKRFPLVKVQPDVLYVDEGTILTSAGSAAGIDLCLHIVRKDFGVRLANRIARRLVVQPHREGGQAQFIDTPVGDETVPWLALLFDWIHEHLHDDLSIKRLAKQSNMSLRTFIRRFEAVTGSSPGEWVIGMRVQRAKSLLELTALSMDDVAAKCGFGSGATLRHHFRKRVKVSPTRYRSSFAVKNDGSDARIG